MQTTDGYKLDNYKANANTDVELKASSKADDMSYKVKKKCNSKNQSVAKRRKSISGGKGMEHKNCSLSFEAQTVTSNND